MTQTPPPTVTYWAVSVFSSRTMWFNAANLLLAALSLTEVATLIPPRFLPLQLAAVALINMWLRQATVRPVALIKPGKTKPIAVAKIEPPAPPLVTD